MPKFRFRSISSDQIGRTSPNFKYAFILARSSLGLLQAIFRQFVPELWPLIYAEISFPLNILRTYWHFFIIFYICIHIDKIYVWIVTYFSHFVPVLWPLIYSKILYLFNNLRTNKQNFTKIYIHCMHSYYQDLHWDCYTSFFTHLYQSYGPWFTP